MKQNKILWIFIHLHKTGGTTFNAHLVKQFKDKFIHLDSKEMQLKFNKMSQKQKSKIKVLAGHEAYYGIHKLIPKKEPYYIVFIRDPAERLVSQYNHQMAQIKQEEQISFNKWYKNYPKNEMVFFFNQRFKPFKKKIQRSTVFQKIILKFTNSNYWKKIRYNLKSFQSKIRPNKKLENAKKLLDKCWFVGITEKLDSDLKFLCKKIGIPANWKNFRVTGKSKTWMNIMGKKAKISYKKFDLDERTRKKIYKENPFDVKLYKYAKKLNKTN